MSAKRVWVLFSFILLVSLIFAGRLFFLQITKGKIYRALAQGQYESLEETQGSRGEILFSNGKKLATNNIKTFVLFSLSKVIEDDQLVKSLEDILQIFLDDFENQKTIKEEITETQEQSLTLLKSSLLSINKQEARFYPQKELAAQVVGFVGGNNQGQYGLEENYEAELRGLPGLFKWEHSPFGFLISNSEELSSSQPGSNLVLTLDYNIQFKSEKLLQEAKDKWGIESGSITIIDPYTGAILAMANFPSFNPNIYAENDLASFQNASIQKLFEPGSIFKAFTMAAGLNEGKITPLTSYIDKGYIAVGGPTIYNYNHEVYGEKNMTEVLEKSINTGAVFVEQSLGSNLFWKYVKRFGFTQPTGIDLVGETYSSNLSLENGYPRDFATASFGQGVAVTPIQLVKAFSAIVNNGKMVQPYMVSEIIDHQGNIKATSTKTEEVINSQTAAQLTTMLVNVVDNGYGKLAQIKGYQIAGKTGTAEVLLPGEMSYDENQTIQTFIGFAPALNPRFLALVKLDNPAVKSSYYSAAPLFGELAEFILNYYQIPPFLNL